jgi:hypothetical protein
MSHDVSLEDCKSFVSGLAVDGYVEILAPFMKAGDGAEIETQRAGRMEHIKLKIDHEGKVEGGTSKKLANIVISLKKSILNGEAPKATLYGLATYDNFIRTLENICDISNPIKMSATLILFLEAVNKMQVVDLKPIDALILKELVFIAIEDNTVMKSHLEQNMQHLSVDVNTLYDSLINLEKLGCIVLTLDEVVLNETIEISRA